jgi:hypothetical protein
MAKGKRGRPKKEPVYRDKGTPELQIKRMFVVKGGDPINASDPLDACQDRGIITSDMAKAGHDYARLYYRIIGKPFNSVNYDKLLHRSDGFVRQAQNPSRGESYAEWLLSESLKVLRDSKSKKIIDYIALEKKFPEFLFEGKAKHKDNKFKEKLRQGLKDLDNLFYKTNKSYRKKK